MRKTPIYEKHCERGGRIIDFGGWALPVEYTGVISEHEKVRAVAGIFDVSHMGEIIVKGPEAEKFVSNLITNSISQTEDMQVVYSPMCYPDGGVVDDLLVYKFSKEFYFLVVNAANIEKDFEWMLHNLTGQVEIENVSDRYAEIAIQGPKAEEILQELTEVVLGDIKFFHFKAEVKIGESEAIVSRTGYTGEDGFEVYINSEQAAGLWEEILRVGKDKGLVPVGLGARDTLRFEAALPLYGHELSKDISPLEAGLVRFVKLEKDSFIGKNALLKQKDEGLKRKLIGFEMIERGIPRNGYEVQSQSRSIGFVTTGSFSPSLKKNIGMALVETNYAMEGTELDIVIRGKPLKAKTVKLPFYIKKYKK